MPKLAAVVVAASVLVTAVASAQLKVPQQQQQTPAVPQPTVQLTPTTNTAEPPLESARRISREEAIKLVTNKKAVYVDVRAKEAYDTEHVKGAINIPLGELLQRLPELPRGKMIITYCA